MPLSNSKPKTFLILIVIGLGMLLLGGFYFVNSYIYNEKQDNNLRHENQREVETTDLPREQREELVSSYIEANISSLSAEPEVLGGTFYVTNITFSGSDSGTVEYEDGHIALVADFEYLLNGEKIVKVELNNVRENQP